MLTNLIISGMKFLMSLMIFSVILTPVSSFIENSIAQTLLKKGEYGFTVIILCFILSGIVYSLRCLKEHSLPRLDSLKASAVRLCFYVLIIMTSFNYESNMVEIYGENLPDDMWYVSGMRHILMNMIIIYELEIINKNYKHTFGSNLPIIGMLVRVRDGIQKKILSKFNVNSDCPMPEDN